MKKITAGCGTLFPIRSTPSRSFCRNVFGVLIVSATDTIHLCSLISANPSRRTTIENRVVLRRAASAANLQRSFSLKFQSVSRVTAGRPQSLGRRAQRHVGAWPGPVWNPAMSGMRTMSEQELRYSPYLNVLLLRLHIGGTAVRRMLAFGVVGLAALLGGCVQDGLMNIARFQLKPDDIIIERRPDAEYEKLFPYYVELCAASQFRSKLTGEGGGPAGHAIIYIKGACKDEDASFPQLRRCRSVTTSLKDPEHGAGISVNRMFKNINWVATPGYELVFPGGLAPGERLTLARFQAIEQQAIAKGIYKGVTFHRFAGGTSDTELRDFLERAGIGTDLALQFARSVFCARLPVTQAMLDPIIKFLNDKNREYAEGEADYNWSAWADNCSHTMRNALAAANIWSPLSVRTTKVRQIFNLAVPANEFVNLAELMTGGDIEDYRDILRDGPRRDAFHEFHWLPTQPGALLKTLPVHDPNDLYDTTFRLFTLQSPFLRGKTQRAVGLLSDQRFVDLDANLQYFHQEYDTILASHDEHGDTLSSVRGTPYRRVERLYYDYVRRQAGEVRSMLQQMAAPGESANQPATD